MRKRKTIVYGLLLLALLPGLLTLLLVGDAYARYDTTVLWNTVISPPDTGQQMVAVGPPILQKAGDTLQFTLSAELQNRENIQYTLMYWSSGGYTDCRTTLAVTPQEGNVTLTLTDTAPKPGAYRLVATWEGDPNTNTQGTEQTAAATFFINYSDAKTQEVTE